MLGITWTQEVSIMAQETGKDILMAVKNNIWTRAGHIMGRTDKQMGNENTLVVAQKLWKLGQLENEVEI